MEQTQNNRFIRSESYLPYDKVSQASVAVIGCGAVGRQVAKLAACMGIGKITLVDFDIIGPENASTQGWDLQDDGVEKVIVLADEIQRFNPSCDVSVYSKKFDEMQLRSDMTAVFACVDSMEIRRQIWEAMPEGIIMIDGRMSLHNSIVLGCVAGEDRYMNHWFPDHEARQDACTARGTLYGATYTASQMVNLLGKRIVGMECNIKASFDFFNMSHKIASVRAVQSEDEGAMSV